MLYSVWLLATVLYLSHPGVQPIAFLMLLPGLAVAVHVQQQLFLHLGENHRPGEKGRLFLTLGAANWITLTRAGMIVWLAGFLPATRSPGHEIAVGLNWAPGLIYLAIILADLLDGFVARRRQRVTELGQRLDVTTDAAGLLMASLLAVSLGRLPAIYLLAGLAYYPFILGVWLRRKWHLPLLTLPPRPFARITAGFQMGLVAVALLPILDRTFVFMAAMIFMIPLLVGFLRDWRVVSGRATIDEDQQTALDRWSGVWLRKRVPLVLRGIVLANGAAILAGVGVDSTHPAGHMAGHLVAGAGCLLIGIGFMGRSAALLLALLLGSGLSPFGISLPVAILFGAAATLMLTGSGAVSLWAPEEPLLYRKTPGK